MAAAAARLTSAREDFGQLLRCDDLELREGAVARLLVGAPPSKLRGVPETTALHVVVGNLDHQLRTQRLPRKVLALAPAAHPTGHALSSGVAVTGPCFPRMPIERILTIGREKIHQLPALFIGKACRDAHVL